MSKKSFSKKKIYYVYALLDSRKPGSFRYGRWVFPFEPFYIGKGKGKRAVHHLTGIAGNKHSKNKIEKMRREGFEVVIQYKYKELTEKQSLKKEVELINKIGRMDLKTGPLTNWSNGGDGLQGLSKCEEFKRKCSIGQKRRFSNPDEIRKVSENQKRWIRENPGIQKVIHEKRCKVICSEEGRAKSAKITTDWIKNNPDLERKRILKRNKTLQSQEHKKAQSIRQGGTGRIGVWKGDKFLGEFVSQREINRQLGVSNCCLTRCLKKGFEQSGGYSIKYL